jgi:hypothetical protein
MREEGGREGRWKGERDRQREGAERERGKRENTLLKIITDRRKGGNSTRNQVTTVGMCVLSVMLTSGPSLVHSSLGDTNICDEIQRLSLAQCSGITLF